MTSRSSSGSTGRRGIRHPDLHHISFKLLLYLPLILTTKIFLHLNLLMNLVSVHGAYG